MLVLHPAESLLKNTSTFKLRKQVDANNLTVPTSPLTAADRRAGKRLRFCQNNEYRSYMRYPKKCMTCRWEFLVAMILVYHMTSDRKDQLQKKNLLHFKTVKTCFLSLHHFTSEKYAFVLYLVRLRSGKHCNKETRVK